MKKTEIYKTDKWNMMHAVVQGKKIVVREISDQWGEETHNFLSRPEMMAWVEQRFSEKNFEGDEQERIHILEVFKTV